MTKAEFKRRVESLKKNPQNNPKHKKEGNKKIFGYDWDIIDAMQHKTYKRPTVDIYAKGDYGADPLGDGRFRMVPSGDIVDLEERNKRLKKYHPNAKQRSLVIYDKLLRIEAQKKRGKFKGQHFYHDFKRDTDAIVLGNSDGSLTIRSRKGKQLWKRFEY